MIQAGEKPWGVLDHRAPEQSKRTAEGDERGTRWDIRCYVRRTKWRDSGKRGENIIQAMNQRKISRRSWRAVSNTAKDSVKKNKEQSSDLPRI